MPSSLETRIFILKMYHVILTCVKPHLIYFTFLIIMLTILLSFGSVSSQWIRQFFNYPPICSFLTYFSPRFFGLGSLTLYLLWIYLIKIITANYKQLQELAGNVWLNGWFFYCPRANPQKCSLQASASTILRDHQSVFLRTICYNSGVRGWI